MNTMRSTIHARAAVGRLVPIATMLAAAAIPASAQPQPSPARWITLPPQPAPINGGGGS